MISESASAARRVNGGGSLLMRHTPPLPLPRSRQDKRGVVRSARSFLRCGFGECSLLKAAPLFRDYESPFSLRCEPSRWTWKMIMLWLLKGKSNWFSSHNHNDLPSLIIYLPSREKEV